MQNQIQTILKESAELKLKIASGLAGQIEAAAKMIIDAYRGGKKVLICGNGGSAADSQHFAAELLGRFKKNRKALPAIALTTDTSILTAIGNDFGFDLVFERQVEGLAQPGDVVIGISTSGRSKNVIRAIEKAKTLGTNTIALSGGNGKEALDQAADLSITIPSTDTPRVQEAHITIIHIICGLVEEGLF
jgi:D-sedoheptulose 7-phosphate isomerase